jgi:hypothetical protein
MTRPFATHRAQSLAPLFERFLADQKGATAVLVGLSIMVLVGFAGMGTEVGSWYVTKRDMQGAADAAAFGAALARAGGSTAYTAEAKSVAANYGYVDQTNGVVISVNSPPISGNHKVASAIEVIVQEPRKRTFSALFSNAALTIKARAVAVSAVGGPACVLALDTGVAADVFTNGTTEVDLVGCGLAVNSNSGSALDIVGGAVINADDASIVGGVAGSGTLNTVNGTTTGASPTQDPYQDVQVPSYSGCNQSSYSSSSHQSDSFDASATGGVYVFCSGASVGAGATLNLSNGVFVIDRGSLAVNGQATLNVTNATVILTSSTGSDYATVDIHGGAVVNATAPTTGATSGLAFFQDRNAPNGVSNNFSGGTTQNITGAVYLPKQQVNFAGGSETGGSTCTQIIGDEVDFKGNANLFTDCTGKGVKTITTPPQLVE